MSQNYGRVIGARLTEDEIASINALMAKHGAENLSELLRAILQGKLSLDLLTKWSEG